MWCRRETDETFTSRDDDRRKRRLCAENEDGVTGTTTCEACDRAHGSGRAVALRAFHECAMSDEAYRAVGERDEADAAGGGRRIRASRRFKRSTPRCLMKRFGAW